MELNKNALIELMNNKFNGSYTKLAKALGIDVAYVYRVLVKERNCGAKFYSCIIQWCNSNDEDYNKYIFLR
ncbi:hypothetical protein CBU02nite_26210 [Clostridium butyricum]|jgi:hypothetical protein|uniref:Uncharacterized protein n=1 Tax=Clostridium butyricum TaxID=1492 RepID=A0A512TPE5_CLOBU|nr:XRE family transcriptional regulator [Clostridium butyricum]NOW24900.1 DNA invertase Pin-like site-specific DNA recombinase [Clostridium butyricum]RQN12519.1 XRE family transcriptional regulator [Clostridium butyricum]GEQ22115.1 hypothetical protein CBU02nite_26210 [Clostridium butyricum]